MTDREILRQAKMYLPKCDKIDKLYELGFLDMYKIMIALIRHRYFYGLKNETGMQMITNLSIDFSVSESVIKRAVYEFKYVDF